MNIIRGLIPKRELYLRRTDATGILRLEVDPASYWLYTSSPVDAAKRAAAVEEHGLVQMSNAGSWFLPYFRPGPSQGIAHKRGHYIPGGWGDIAVTDQPCENLSRVTSFL